MVLNPIPGDHDEVEAFEDAFCQNGVDVIAPEIFLEVLKEGGDPAETGLCFEGQFFH